MVFYSLKSLLPSLWEIIFSVVELFEIRDLGLPYSNKIDPKTI